MGLKSLLCVLLIFLSFPISISSLESPSNSTSPHQKQATALHAGLGHHNKTEAYDVKRKYVHTTSSIAPKKDADGRIHAYIKKGSHGKGGGANEASHHTPANGKNLASSLPPPSSFIFSMIPCVVIFGFFPL